MSEINDGGPAFACDGDRAEGRQKGMTLRDYMTGQQLVAYRAHPADEGSSSMGNVAKYCYMMADAMLKERIKETL